MKATSDPSRLAPEDAYLRQTSTDSLETSSRERQQELRATAKDTLVLQNGSPERRPARFRSKRPKTPFKKLLWVKQPYPDNYTDEATFLDALQRNPRLIPYAFWSLVADSTVIVQQVCTVVIFVSCFVGILQERSSPVTIARWSTTGTILGWLLWDLWTGKNPSPRNEDRPASSSTVIATTSDKTTVNPSNPLKPGSRNQQRKTTAKSAILIYCTLLGLSPILKSLTRSTSSDSIWAISFWLLCINVIFFDYSGSVGATFPASLSTNAALMASTVLASRLDSTMHVFSLTLFSIQVFGLFPIFRRYLRHASRYVHFILTWVLVMGAGSSASVAISGGGVKAALLGLVLGCLITGLAMGLCSWWLIGLQHYKNEIRGPWDPARPIIRRGE